MIENSQHPAAPAPTSSGATAAAPARGGGHDDAVVDLDRLTALYAAHDAGRASLNQKQLPMFERTLRKTVAQHVLTRQLPMLVAELLEAAADDLTPATAAAAALTVSALETQPSHELRRCEAVEHCKAALDALGAAALGRLHADIDAAERSGSPRWGAPRPRAGSILSGSP